MTRRERSRFFYASPEKLRRARFSFDEEEERHLTRVLRLGEGAEVRVADGEGRVALVRLHRGKDGLEGEVRERFPSEVEPALRTTLALAVLKGKGMDDAVERAAELGADALLPYLPARAVPRRDREREERTRERWARIAREGMKVAGGARAMRIEPAATMEELAEEIGRRGNALLCSRSAAEPLLPREDPGELIVVIGPEGGLERREEELLLRAGARPVRLGPRNLRAATAVVVALSRLFAPQAPPDEKEREKNRSNG